ncbi:exosortase [Psychrosphaera sp.]|nr:exosortase [Psychrosphaera sp.]
MTTAKTYKFLILVASFFSIALLNLNVSESIWKYSFDDGTYSHAPLILVIISFLFYDIVKTNALTFRKHISLPALVLLFGSSYLFWVATNAQFNLLYWGLTPVLLFALCNTLFKFNFKLLFATLYLVFLIPIWGVLIVPLQTLSVKAVSLIMSFTSMPVFISGTFVEIPSGVFEIAGGCSGLRYFITSLAISSLFSYLHLNQLKSKIYFIALAIILALITNWVRIALLIGIGHYTEMQSGLMEDHNMFGWYLFVPVIFGLLKYGDYLGNKDAEPVSLEVVESGNTLSISAVMCGVVTIVLFSSALKALFMESNKNYENVDGVKNELLNLSMSNQDSTAPLVHYYSKVNINKNSNEELNLTYFFNGQNLDEKPTYYENVIIPKGWSVVERDNQSEQALYHLSKGKSRALLAVSYQVEEQKVATISEMKKLRLLKALLGQNQTKLNWHLKQLPNHKLIRE